MKVAPLVLAMLLFFGLSSTAHALTPASGTTSQPSYVEPISLDQAPSTAIGENIALPEVASPLITPANTTTQPAVTTTRPAYYDCVITKIGKPPIVGMNINRVFDVYVITAYVWTYNKKTNKWETKKVTITEYKAIVRCPRATTQPVTTQPYRWWRTTGCWYEVRLPIGTSPTSGKEKHYYLRTTEVWERDPATGKLVKKTYVVWMVQVPCP